MAGETKEWRRGKSPPEDRTRATVTTIPHFFTSKYCLAFKCDNMKTDDNGKKYTLKIKPREETSLTLSIFPVPSAF